ncbi:flagellar P-ring protein precursor FlgI [Neorhodopirellula lusitana]|uniref:Flagellar P-ring protein FlgI n=1 Tax=Neorhodopirellula lusitana TaxID=445327 RepID=A0ABY1Q8Y6_9BACT|nr:flagellar basal body P-ring protein FlgI [Neorhodopirellula lusitana]SMP63525.1 flagellar P-ring protein precursor FlgI [Neorhodopirellula lusitana]
MNRHRDMSTANRHCVPAPRLLAAAMPGSRLRESVGLWWLCCLIVVVTLVFSAVPAWGGGMKLGDLCRLKGQETNTLQGLGLVVGLRGTGDGDAAPTSRALARMMQLMGGPMAVDAAGNLNLGDVEDSKNVAMVFVNAKLPTVGAQQGDVLDVTISAISAKSLEGGYLMLTPMLGPRADNPTVYAMAQGRIQLSPDSPATNGTIQGGMKMETTVRANYVKDNGITLIIDRDFADFNTAQRIEDEINSLTSLTMGSQDSSRLSSGGIGSIPQARAIDQLHVEVTVPKLYQDNPIKFISFLLNIPVQLANRGKRVVINEADGVVVIGDDVEIAPVLVTHRNLRIEAGGGNGFVELGPDGTPAAAKLKSLADALGALDVPTEDLIAIIKTLKAKGDLYGEVIFR